MNSLSESPDGPNIGAIFQHILFRTVRDSLERRGIHTRRARDGVAYTWEEFLEWYECQHFTEVRLREARPISRHE